MKKLWFAIMLGILLTSCTNQPPADELVLPTRIHTPTQAATPVPTATPTALVLADHSGQTEPYPNLKVITAENVYRLEEVDVWGQGTVLGIALSPDASTVAVSTATGIYFYDAVTMEQIDWIDFYVIRTDCLFNNCGYTYDNLDYSPDGKTLLIGFDDLYVVNLESREVTVFKTEDTNLDMERSFIMEAIFSEDGKHILFTRASLQPYGYQMLFEIYETNSPQSVFQYDFTLINYVARIYLISENLVAIDQLLVDIESGNILKEEDPYISDAVDQMIKFDSILDDQWQVTLPKENFTCVFAEDFSSAFSYDMYDFSEDHNILITFDEFSDRVMKTWNFNNCQETEQFLLSSGWSRNIDISAEGNYIITSNSLGNIQYLWDVYTKGVVASTHAMQIASDAYDSQFYVLVYVDTIEPDLCSTVIKNTFTTEEIFRVDGCLSTQLEINPLDEKIFFIDNVLINLHQSTPVVKEYTTYPYQFTPNGKYIVFLVKQSSNRNAFLYFDSVTNGELVPSETKRVPIPADSRLKNTEIAHFQISPTGRYVAFHGEGEYLIWDTITEESFIIDDETENGNILQLMFFPADELLLTRDTLSNKTKLRIWDLKTKKVVYEAPLPANLSAGPVISPDGKFLAFLGYDGTIRIYGVRSETK